MTLIKYFNKLNSCELVQQKHIQWRSKLQNNLQFAKFQGHCLLLFEVILTGGEGQFLKGWLIAISLF